MKEHLLNLAAQKPDPRLRLNLVREYLQASILRSLQESGAFAALAFQGGTALRFLHGLRRFSEDLGFSLERPEHHGGLPRLVESVMRDMELEGYEAETRLRTRTTVHSALLKFPRILMETGLSQRRLAKLAVRLDVDTRPPAGAVEETRLVTRHFPMVFRAHDLRSCMAGKVHALLTRPYTKGRDLFDLAWYLTHPERPSPNMELLRNALAQTGWDGPPPSEESWTGILAARLSSLDWGAAVRDVEPFLEDSRDLRLLDRDLVLAELARG